MNQLVEMLTNIPKFKELSSDINLKTFEDIYLSGLTDSQKTHMIYSLGSHIKKNGLIVTYSEIQAKKIIKDLEFFSNDSMDIVFFPKRELIYFNADAVNKDIEKQRVNAIEKIISSDNIIVVTTIEALMQKMMPFETYKTKNIMLEVGSNIDLNTLAKKLVDNGYERTETVEGAGQYACRGGIIDIYPLCAESGMRIELFGDEIDSIRQFDIDTQRTIRSLDSVIISTAKEYIIGKDEIDNVLNTLNKIDLGKEISDMIDIDYQIIQSGNADNLVDKYFELICPKGESLIDYINSMGTYLIYLDEPNRIMVKSESIERENSEVISNHIERKKLIAQYANKVCSYIDIQHSLKDYTVINFEKLKAVRILNGKKKEYIFNGKEINFLRSTMDIFIKQINDKIAKGTSVILVYRTIQKAEYISKQLKDNEVKNNIVNINDKGMYDILKDKTPQVYITCGTLSSGFEYDETGIKVLVYAEEKEVNKGLRKQQGRSFTNAEKVILEDLRVGDFVVHTNHGIGRYIGIKPMEVSGIKKDYITIEYSSGGVLYVPTNQMNSVMKYLGDENKEPKLNSLSSKEWNKTKEKAKKSLENIAKELILLYSERQNTVGFEFSKDTVWQNDFEDRFPYTETDDQLRCIEEVKHDMESQVPMDRLLCGDVGYGKTEVAIRAAFKAAMDQKQVAYLVPTTVLAMQQYELFKERMKEFPVNVEVLCRFRTAKEQEKIVKKLRSGEIDILIGTHSIIQQRVVYKDLGLLIVDEEQRFGVKHKEKIKQYKNNIDVLTMSATPIPRTMHMSIVGIRDMSTIHEPPQDRIPVQTYVTEYDDDTIKQALENEIDRGGQIIYIYNRVEGIDRVVSHVRGLIPDARIAYAHGQMASNELESIMYDFVNHNIDIIVCTTILESGIDVPNANTLIIENADKMGLAQLYQIRGRVGRGNRMAHAYITYRKDRSISEVAEKRLKAIKEFTEFGSGFKIALRDLEIRGAGNILGAEQHGQMESVGYDMYCRLLEEAIREQGKDNILITKKIGSKEISEDFEVKIDVDVNAYIPDTYISNSEQKIAMYQKISYIIDEESKMNVIDEMQDRYGDIPECTLNLIKIMEIKLIAQKMKIKYIKQRENKITLEPFCVFTLTKTYKDDILGAVKNMLKSIEEKRKDVIL